MRMSIENNDNNNFINSVLKPIITPDKNKMIIEIFIMLRNITEYES